MESKPTVTTHAGTSPPKLELVTARIGQLEAHYVRAMEHLDDRQPLLLDALTGLRYAQGVVDCNGVLLTHVHRDVTPQSVFVTYERQFEVVDFGIAKKAVDRSAEAREGVIKGKVRHMLAEQTLGQKVARRGDIFAAGVPSSTSSSSRPEAKARPRGGARSPRSQLSSTHRPAQRPAMDGTGACTVSWCLPSNSLPLSSRKT